MPRYTLTESVGNHVDSVHSFEDLHKHHPSSGRQPGRDYQTIDGKLEEVRIQNGHTYIKKDFILSQDTPGPVNVPAPAAGYVHYLHDETNAVRIYDKPYGTPGAVMQAQALHMVPGTSPPEGSHVQYGQPLGRMGDTGSPGSVHAHVEAELGQFQGYIRDINSGAIRPGLNPVHGQHGAPHAADGILMQGDKGAAVGRLQTDLKNLGYTGADGKPLKVDSDFGPATQAAVETFQRDHHLTVDGKAGPKTQEALHAQTQAHAHAKAAPPGLDDPKNPDHALYEQALAGVRKLDAQAGRPSDQHSANLAAALVVDAKKEGITHIDHVALSTDGGSRVFAVQNGSPAQKFAEVPTLTSLNTPIAQSSAAVQQLNQQPAPPVAQPAQPVAQPPPQVPTPAQSVPGMGR